MPLFTRLLDIYKIHRTKIDSTICHTITWLDFEISYLLHEKTCLYLTPSMTSFARRQRVKLAAGGLGGHLAASRHSIYNCN